MHKAGRAFSCAKYLQRRSNVNRSGLAGAGPFPADYNSISTLVRVPRASSFSTISAAHSRLSLRLFLRRVRRTETPETRGKAHLPGSGSPDRTGSSFSSSAPAPARWFLRHNPCRGAPLQTFQHEIFSGHCAIDGTRRATFHTHFAESPIGTSAGNGTRGGGLRMHSVRDALPSR